jgi:pyruvate,water dikinase
MIKDGKQREFVDQLAEMMATFCRAFSLKPVVYRATDFKTNEYRSLKGGDLYEPNEPNPMLGFRGASRYITDEKTFLLELEAIKKVRNKFGLKNLHLMIPFVRTPQELMEVKKIIVSSGLSRTVTFKLWMMVEIPSNVILLEDFLQVGIDGVSIGSNDLTMLILGTDRDNSEVASVFNENDPAVLWALEKVIKTCIKNKVSCSICGQAPSEYPELVEKLVDWGITSISVNPDAVERVRETIYHAEQEILKGKIK